MVGVVLKVQDGGRAKALQNHHVFQSFLYTTLITMRSLLLEGTVSVPYDVGLFIASTQAIKSHMRIALPSA